MKHEECPKGPEAPAAGKAPTVGEEKGETKYFKLKEDYVLVPEAELKQRITKNEEETNKVAVELQEMKKQKDECQKEAEFKKSSRRKEERRKIYLRDNKDQ